MAALTRSGKNAAATQTFDALTIGRRALVTQSRTIAIASIATVSVGTHADKPARLVWIALAFVCAGLIFAATAADIGFKIAGINATSVLAAAAALAFLVLGLRPGDKTPYLLISSSDGVVTRFVGAEAEFLDDVRQLLTGKINNGDDAHSYVVDFERRVIEKMAPQQNGAPAARSGLNGMGSGLSGGRAAAPGASSNPSSYGQPALSTTDRTGGSESTYPTSHASGAHTNPTRTQGGPSHAPTDAHVDFGAYLPAIVEMHRFYARQAGAQHLEQRLSEFELLMRSGTPTAAQKSRVRELARELAHILQAYPQAVQLFQDINGLVRA